MSLRSTIGRLWSWTTDTGERIPVEIYLHLLVVRELYYGDLPIERLSGFKDERTGAVITNAFTTGKLDPNDVTRNWKRLAAESDAPRPPAFKFVGLIGYDGD